LLPSSAEVIGGIPPLPLDAFMAWTGTTSALPSVCFGKAECGQKIRKMEHNFVFNQGCVKMDEIKSVLTRWQTVYSVTWYTDFTKAFITFKILYGFMVHV
jgi:hypothetical protein